MARSFVGPVTLRTEAIEALTEALGDVHGDTVRLFLHVYKSGGANRKKGGWVPLYSRVRERDVPRADHDGLVSSGLLEMVPHSRAHRRSREYRVAPHVQRRLSRAVLEGIRTLAEIVDAVTGQKRRGRKPGNANHDESGHPYPQIIRDAMSTIQTGYINLSAVLAHMDRLGASVTAAEQEADLAEASGNPDAEGLREEADRAAAREANDVHCLAWIVDRGLTPTDTPGVCTYPHAWDVQQNGRINPRGSGGAQSCSREMQAAMYEGVPGVRNYDLKSSQPRLLIDELERAGLDSSWLRTYIEGRKEDYAREAGLGDYAGGVGAWKTCFLALVMGGPGAIPQAPRGRPVEYYTGRGLVRRWRLVAGSLEAVERVTGPDSLPEVWTRVRAVLAPFLDVMKDWHAYLRDTWLPARARRAKGGTYVENAAGSRLRVEDVPSKKLSKVLAAFVLQGREARIIHELTVLADDYVFEPIANMHDGLVTIGEIPEAAVREAVRRAGVPDVELVEKPFDPSLPAVEVVQAKGSAMRASDARRGGLRLLPLPAARKAA